MPEGSAPWLRGAGLAEPLLLAHFAVPLTGGVLVAINTRLSADEVAYIVEHSGARWIFCSPELASLLEGVAQDVTRLDLQGDFEDLLASGSDEPLEPGMPSEDDILAIDYTSGTTGRPRASCTTSAGRISMPWP